MSGRKTGETALFGAFFMAWRLKLPLGTADAMNGYMTSMTKTAPEVTVGLFTVFSVIAAKVRAAIEAQVPLGYQDETGFHTGIKPRGQEATSTSDW
ncbi:MAG: hypothetical protein ABSA47_17665 [Verrucomicrobiota bacterium]